MIVHILYEDNHLLVVEKPVNLPVQADESGDADLLTLLKEDLKKRYQKPGNVYLGLVHRLDRPVGGVMVFAKTSKAASRLSDVLRKREMERTYLTVVRGSLKKNYDVLEHHLWKDTKKNKVHTVKAGHPDGKKAILQYEAIEENGRHEPIECPSTHRQIPSNPRSIGCSWYPSLRRPKIRATSE